MKRIVTTEDATGNIVAEWTGGEDQSLASPPAGFTRRDVSAAGGAVDYSRKRWNGSAFVDVAPPTPELKVTRADFARLFTRNERIAIRDRQQVADATAKVISDFYSLLEFSGEVRLGHADTVAGLTYMVRLGLLTDARKTAILANQPPA